MAVSYDVPIEAAVLITNLEIEIVGMTNSSNANNSTEHVACHTSSPQDGVYSHIAYINKLLNRLELNIHRADTISSSKIIKFVTLHELLEDEPLVALETLCEVLHQPRQLSMYQHCTS